MIFCLQNRLSETLREALAIDDFDRHAASGTTIALKYTLDRNRPKATHADFMRALLKTGV